MTCLLIARCRNLVTDLFKYEQIKTTVAKAKETARLAEKVGIPFMYVMSKYSNVSHR